MPFKMLCPTTAHSLFASQGSILVEKPGVPSLRDFHPERWPGIWTCVGLGKQAKGMMITFHWVGCQNTILKSANNPTLMHVTVPM